MRIKQPLDNSAIFILVERITNIVKDEVTSRTLLFFSRSTVELFRLPLRIMKHLVQTFIGLLISYCNIALLSEHSEHITCKQLKSIFRLLKCYAQNSK